MCENIKTSECMKLHGKDGKGALLGKRIEKTRLSSKSKRPVHESLSIDDIKGEKYHCIKEKNKSGNWKIVHQHREIQKRKKI